MSSEDDILVDYTTKLPTELLVMALSDLEMPDLVRCSQVSRRFHKTVTGSLALQYRIALQRVGAVDNDECKLSTAQKLQRLESQERAWSYIKPRRRDRIPIPRRFGSFDLCGGVLVGAKAIDPTEVDTEAANAAPESDEDDLNARELLATTLPSVISGDTAVRSWSRNVGFPVYGLGIDTAQDLAIVIQSRTSTEDPFRIHLMSLSTFRPHPSAAQPFHAYQSPVPVSQIAVRCLGDLVGVMFQTFDADVFQQTLLIFDWVNGIPKACIESVKEERLFDDFAFLTADTVILPLRRPGPAALDVYKLDTRKVARRSERLSRGSLPPAIRIASFLLPPMRDPMEVSVNPICVNSEPPLKRTYFPASSEEETRCPPFYPNGQTSLLSFSFMVCHGHSVHSTTPLHERFTLVMHRQALLDRIEETLRPTNGRWVGSHWKAVVYPWGSWGPHASRWLTMRHLSWACFMSGSRLIMSPLIPEDRSMCHLSILDFNPYAVAKERQRRHEVSPRPADSGYCDDAAHTISKWGKLNNGKGKQVSLALDDSVDELVEDKPLEDDVLVKLVDYPGLIQSGKVWAEPVYSYLPYRQVTTKESFPYANVVIDEERIGGILVNEHGDLTDVEILTM